MLPPVLCVSLSHGAGAHDTTLIHLQSGFTLLKDTPSRAALYGEAPSLPLSLWKGNSTPVLKRTPSGYKKGCRMLFRSSPSSGNHSRSSFTRRSSSRIQTHAIFNTFSPHFRTHLPHCLIHRSRSISNKTMDLMQEALYKILWHLWIFFYLLAYKQNEADLLYKSGTIVSPDIKIACILRN